MRILSTLLLLILYSNLNGQIDTIEQSLISATSEFRNSILSNSPNYKDYEKLISRWKEIEEDERIIDVLLYNITYGIQMYDLKYKNIKKRSKKHLKNSALPDSISLRDIEIIKNNLDLISFIQDDYLEKEFPYKISLDTTNILEIKFMDIQPNELIADIGSGNGNQILLTSLIYHENDFILSENDFSLIYYLQEKIKRNRNLLFQSERSIDIAVGKNKTLNLGARVDKIIVRNSFHHFNKKEEMLESMAEYLNPNGSVIFIEPLRSSTNSVDACKDKMDQEDVINLINQSPLKIIKKEFFDNILFIRCKVKE